MAIVWVKTAVRTLGFILYFVAGQQVLAEEDKAVYRKDMNRRKTGKENVK